MTEEQARGASALPGWTRAHLLANRLTFLRAAVRQIDYALRGEQIAFFQDGPDPRAADRAARDAAIEANAHRPVSDLVTDVQAALLSLEAALSRLGPSDWTLPARYRGRGTLLDVLLAGWRESEIHLADFQLGLHPSDWSPELCAHVLEYRADRRTPEGIQLELVTPDSQSWLLGSGELVRVTGSLTDLTAWFAGRNPDGPVTSSSGALPELRP